MSILPARLKPDDAEGAEQPKQCANLKLPLANDVAFLGKKGEREERGEDDRCPSNNGEDARAHVKERDDLSDLVDDIWQTGDQAKTDGADVDLWSAPKLKQNERDNGETGDRVTVEVLRPWIVEAIAYPRESRRVLRSTRLNVAWQSDFRRSEVRAALALDWHKFAGLRSLNCSTIKERGEP
jgi:hypothetical protein